MWCESSFEIVLNTTLVALFFLLFVCLALGKIGKCGKGTHYIRGKRAHRGKHGKLGKKYPNGVGAYLHVHARALYSWGSLRERLCACILAMFFVLVVFSFAPTICVHNANHKKLAAHMCGVSPASKLY